MFGESSIYNVLTLLIYNLDVLAEKLNHYIICVYKWIKKCFTVHTQFDSYKTLDMSNLDFVYA